MALEDYFPRVDREKKSPIKINFNYKGPEQFSLLVVSLDGTLVADSKTFNYKGFIREVERFKKILVQERGYSIESERLPQDPSIPF